MNSLVLPVAIGAAAVGGWFVLYALVLLATRPGPRPVPAPPRAGPADPAHRRRGGRRPGGRRRGRAGRPTQRGPAASRGGRLLRHPRDPGRNRPPVARRTGHRGRTRRGRPLA